MVVLVPTTAFVIAVVLGVTAAFLVNENARAGVTLSVVTVLFFVFVGVPAIIPVSVETVGSGAKVIDRPNDEEES